MSKSIPNLDELRAMLAELIAEQRLLDGDRGRSWYWYQGKIDLLKKILGVE